MTTYNPGYVVCSGPVDPWLATLYSIFPAVFTSLLGSLKFSPFFIAAKRLSQFHWSLPIMAASVSTSTLLGRTWYMPFTADEPPSTLPPGHPIERPCAPGCGTVEYAQS